MNTKQHAIDSGFVPSSTVSDVIKGIDLSGKNAIVTGASSGLGLETAKTLAAAGANVTIPVHNLEKAKNAVSGVPNIEIKYMDLLNPDSIDAFAKEFLETGKDLHILVNSAGIMAIPNLSLDKRGYEQQFAVNYLGHFQLTLNLLPSLRRANGARVVSVASRGHQLSNIYFDDINFKKRKYTPMLGYAQSKTANILFAVALDKKEEKNGIHAFAVHPGGIVSTDLIRYQTKEQLEEFGVIDKQGNPIIDPDNEFKTLQQGAATQVWCATNPKLNDFGGVYCEDSNIANLLSVENPKQGLPSLNQYIHGVMPYAVDEYEADRLWILGKEMIGK